MEPYETAYSFLSPEYHYLFHMLAWMLPALLLQWAVGWKILLRHWNIILAVPAIVGTYLIFTDMVAVAQGVWFFDERQILGWSPGGVPIEEWGFFYLTSLLVVQCYLLLLPQKHRKPLKTKAAAN
ncbi:MAG: lycopene cyclase domain-containing protein [Opitutales bacterium]|nr:lycopene cyclase domain-containing protein [Opitutales bacterium]MCH8541011.1 lycopene cyclase domain-containing protein [Opitutales bacterium]